MSNYVQIHELTTDNEALLLRKQAWDAMLTARLSAICYQLTLKRHKTFERICQVVIVIIVLSVVAISAKYTAK